MGLADEVPIIRALHKESIESCSRLFAAIRDSLGSSIRCSGGMDKALPDYFATYGCYAMGDRINCGIHGDPTIVFVSAG